MEPFETYERSGCRVSLYPDYDAENPYSAIEQPSRLLLGSALERAGWCDARGNGWGERMPHPEMSYEEDPSSAVMCRYLTLFGGYVLALPFTFADYGSSGQRAWITSPDDEPASGYVVMSAKDRDRIGVPIGSEEEAARTDFGVFASWLEGEVCGYVVENPDGEHVASCWGFYGTGYGSEELQYVRDEANAAADDWNHDRLVNQEPIDVAEVIGR